MGRFDDTGLQQWTVQENSPAAAAGLQQDAEAGRGVASGSSRWSDSSLGQYINQSGYAANAQSWYTGANREGTNNGWDNAFVQQFVEGQNKAAQQGTLNTYFEQKNATGVVTWDHDSTDGTTRYKFGDIYQGGRHVGNVFDQFDKPTADLMMADWLFDAKTKAKIYGSDDPTTALDSAVRGKREENNVNIPKAMQAADFNQKVEERSTSIEEGGSEAAIVGGAIAGGAGLGAGLGAAAGLAGGPLAPVTSSAGALIGGAIGGVAGGVGAILNRDALADQAARAYEITALSSRENGAGAGFATGVQQWSGFGGKLISPLQNVYQGTYEWASDAKIGDGKADFYAVDKKGHSTVPKWVKIGDVAAAIGDSAIQFSSPIGATLFTAQMSGTIGGEVGELALTGGKSFDYSRGGFDSIFTDDKGNFAPSRALAGIGKVGIDAVQLGMARGLMSKTDAALSAVGKDTAYGAVRTGLGRLATRLSGNAGRTEIGEHAGFKFFRDAADGTITKRPTLSILAPSEQLQGLSARVMGMRAAAAREGGVYSADDFYRAAHSMATGERRIVNALVTGMGEGYEEAIQAVLEPYSHNSSVSMGDIGSAALYGFAGGVGMGIGTSGRAPNAADKLYNQAALAHFFRTNGEKLSRSAFDSMDPAQQRTLAALSGLERSTAQAAFQKFADDHAIEHSAGVVGIHKLLDAYQSQLKQNLAKATDNTSNALVITALEDGGLTDADGNVLPNSMPNHAMGASGMQTARNLALYHRGIAVQLDQLKRDLDELNTVLAKNPGDADATEKQAAYTQQVTALQLTLEWAQKFDTELDAAITRMYDPDATAQTIEADAIALNESFRLAFDRQVDTFNGEVLTDDDKDALARAVSLIPGRDPHDHSGSYQVLVPQVSPKLTWANSDNVVEISNAILPAISGDFDGDKLRILNQLILNQEQYTSARAGQHFIGAGTAVNVPAPKYEKYVLDQLAKAHASTSVALNNAATGTMTDIASAIRRRYTGVVDDSILDDVLKQFFDAMVAGSPSARATLLDGLAGQAGSQITEFARGNLSNEWLWIDQLVRSHIDNFQGQYAAHRPDQGPTPNTTIVAPNKQSTQVRQRIADEAAVLGMTMGLELPGDSLFRMFQKLHYTSLSGSVLDSEDTDTRVGLYQMAKLYESLSSFITQAEIDEVRGKDDITSRVFAQLKWLSADLSRVNPELSGTEALTVVANLAVLDIDVTDGVTTTNGDQITLAQMLLKRSVARDRVEKDAIYDVSPELQAKHAKLLSMTHAPRQGRTGSNPVNAERAFVEILGSQSLYSLLGDNAEVFGQHLTVEQFTRSYAKMHEDLRRETDAALRQEAAYLGRENTHNLPYNYTEVIDGDISAYRSVVDAIIAVGHNRITLDKAKLSAPLDENHLHGEFANRHYETSKQFQSSITDARSALMEFAGLSPRRDGELTVEMVSRMFQQNPDVARGVMKLIPNSAANSVLMARSDGSVAAANWVYKTFTFKDAAQAEMHFYRNLLLAEWNSLGVNTDTEEDDPEVNARKYSRLPRRMHQLMFQLAPEIRGDNGLMMSKFITELENATSLEAFLRWANSAPGVRGMEAPFAGWVDDVAEFAPDKAKGGWTTALQGAELREAISSLQRGSQLLVKDLAAERAAVKNDTNTIQAIRRVLKADKTGDNSALSSGDRPVYKQFVKAIRESGDRAVSMGPAAMMHQIVGAVRGFNAQSHTKGTTPDNVNNAGAYDAGFEAFDYVSNYERLMASLTAVNLDAVNSNMALAAKDSLRSMDDYGRPVEWELPTDDAELADQMLKMFENADTRPLARAVMFPQVMERDFDGVLRQKMLHGKSLKDMLNGTSQAELANPQRKLTHDNALRYLSLLEGQARRHGGHFSVQRAITELLIARTSAADHTLSTFEIEGMASTAMLEVAEVLQAAGSIAANSMAPGVDPLADMLADAKSAQRLRRTASQLGMKWDPTNPELTDRVFNDLIQERTDELEKEIQDLLDLITPGMDPAEEQRLTEESGRAQADQEKFKTRVELLKHDDMAGQVVAMFSLSGNPGADAHAKTMIFDYITANLSLLERSTSSMLTMRKLTDQMRDSAFNGQPQLTDKEWDELSRAVTAVYLDDVVSNTAPNVSVPPFPDAEHTQDHRYYDPTFGYLLDPLMSQSSPLVQAAADVYKSSGLFNVQTSQEEMLNILGRTIYSDFSFGGWTSDIPRASIEAGQRLDAAAAAVAIAMAGNSPKRQAVISAATRRTFEIPGDELLSAVKLSSFDLANLSDFDDIDVTMPGGVASTMPLVQLNNRFAKTVTMEYLDDQGQTVQVDLLAADSNLGQIFHTNDIAANSGLQSVHRDRIRQAVERQLPDTANPSSVSVTMQFFHPDSQPAKAKFYNNLFFEGTSFRLDADRFADLNSSLWFAYGGLNPEAQRAALDANKLGKKALASVDAPDSTERIGMEQVWQTDFASMLRAKTRRMLETDIGTGFLDPDFYNAAYKNMKLRHFVRGTDIDGNAVLLTAEQVIAAQAAGEALPTDATLWVPTDDVLRSLLGEQGGQGVTRVLSPDLDIDLAKVDKYQGTTPAMLARFEQGVSGETASLPETRISNRARQSSLVLREQLTDTARQAYEQKMKFFAAQTAEINNDRAMIPRSGKDGFKPNRALARVIKRGSKMLQAENIAFDWTTAGISFIGPRDVSSTLLSSMLLNDLVQSLEKDGYKMGWIFREGGPSKPPRGEISDASIGRETRAGMRIAPGDIVMVELDSFNGDREVAKKRIDYFVNHGATVVLGAANGQADMRAEMAEHLDSRLYEKIAGSDHVYQPAVLSGRYQNQKARASGLLAMRGVNTKSMVANLLLPDKVIEESAAWVVGGDERFGAIKVGMDLAPVDAFGGFNVPVETMAEKKSQIDKVRAQLFGMDTAEGRELLRDMSADPKWTPQERARHDKEFELSFDRLIQRLQDNSGTVLPQPGDDFGTGDLIPLVDQFDNVLLYRHGFKAPTRFGKGGLNDMLARTRPGSDASSNIAIYPGMTEPSATTHFGTVVEFKPRSGFGLSVELNIPLQQFGAKKVLEWNGMKYLLTPMPDNIVLPDHGFFSNGWGINMISSAHDAASKESFEGVVRSHGAAFTYLGIDFMPDLKKFFEVDEAGVRAILDGLRSLPRIQVAAAEELLDAERLGNTFTSLLGGTPWAAKVNDQTVESKIATAIMIYMMLPGARIDDVLQSGGFNDDTAQEGSMSVEMPQIFTQYFDNQPVGSALRTELNRRFNEQLHNPHNDGTGYSLDEYFGFHIINGTTSRAPTMSLPMITQRFTDRGMSVAVETEAKVIDGVERPLVKLVVTKPGESFGGHVGHLWFDANDGEIISVSVLDKFQKQGVARDLMRNAEAVAQRDGYAAPRHSDVLSAEGRAFAAAVAPSTQQTGDATKNLSGWLQFAEVHDSGDNPVTNGQAFDDTERGSVSAHSAAIDYMALGGARTPMAYDIAKARAFTSAEGITRFERDVEDGGVWRMLTGIKPESLAAGARWRAQTPGESMRRSVGADAKVQFRQEIEKTEANGWSEKQRTDYADQARQVTRKLNLQDNQIGIVDYWVRQTLGMPKTTNEAGEQVNIITGKGALSALTDIRDNVEGHYLPVLGGEVPLLTAQDLQLIYRANQEIAKPWLPKSGLESTATPATQWNDWVNVSLGGAFTSDNLFDPMFLIALDGHMHTYQNATASLLDLPVSMDVLVSQKLLDENTNRMLLSLDPNTDLLESQPMLLDIERATLDELIGGQRVAGKYMGKYPPAAEISKRREARRRWRKENDVPVAVDVSMKDFRKNGAEFINHSTNMNALSRMLINLRVGTALLNPALYLSMGPEQWIRGTLDRAANIITGQDTAGITGSALAKVGLSIYTPDQIDKMRSLYRTLGSRNDFKKMVYSELMYLRPHAPGISKVEKALAAYARFGSRVQDPTWGMRADTLARRYMDAALQSINADPLGTNLTPDLLIAAMSTNPEFLKDHHPEIHKQASNAIAQLRSLKTTPLSLALRGIYEPLSESSNSAVSFLGTVVLKMPLLFSGYAANVITTITGLQGASDMTAMFLHGRTNGFKHPATLLGRVQAKLAGREITADDDKNFDMSSVMEGIDLSRSFIRGGLTHTGLFMFGMMAGGLGLSGEDDETKKRRRAAELQGAGFIYDPRRLENDFRNADAVFLDWMPDVIKNWYQVTDAGDGQGARSMMQLNWTLKQFISPIMGMEKFYETGDFKQVTWGFQDAIGAFPLINTLMWDDSVSTAHELATMADGEAKLGGPANLIASAGLLTNAVGVYEKMLFENAFVNQLYTSFDRYDRDPYKLPLTDSDGTIQKDIERNARPNDLAMEPYVDPETGTIQMGYMGRDVQDATMHALTENRFTLATGMNLFTGLVGGSGDYYRRQMPVKTREIEKIPQTKADAEALIRAALQGQGGLQNLSADELAQIWKNQAKAAGQYVDWGMVDKAAAAAAAKGQYGTGAPAPLSVLDKQGREVLTKDGMRAVFQGLVKGSVKLGDASLAGIYIPYDMRNEIQTEWTKELVQEGLDMGLDQTKATSRMKRLWGGAYGTDEVGIGDILWSKDISYSDTVTYKQLNTTYVMGPDGRPWATGFTRPGFLGALGAKPGMRAYVSEQSATGTDGRLNTTDYINGINTGLRALEIMDDSALVPTDVEIGKSIEEAIKAAANQQYTPYTPYASKSNGYSPFGYSRRGYGHSYGGYSGGGGSSYFTRMYALPGGQSPYGRSIPMINTSNPILRRGDVRRERVWSERGRLKQWQ